MFLTLCPILRTLNDFKNYSNGNICSKSHKTLSLQTKFESIFTHRKSILVWICMISKYSHFSAGLEERLIEVKHSMNISNMHIFLCKKSLLFLLQHFISLDIRSSKMKDFQKWRWLLEKNRTMHLWFWSEGKLGSPFHRINKPSHHLSLCCGQFWICSSHPLRLGCSDLSRLVALNPANINI